MNKMSLNLQIPFAVACTQVINPHNGLKYSKRVTEEFKRLQDFCRENSVFMRQTDVDERGPNPELHYKNLWININPDFVKKEIINGIFECAYNCIDKQTTTKFVFEK